MYRTVLCLLGFITLAFSCGSKDDEGSTSDWSDTGRDSGGYYDSDDAYFCMVISETCDAFLDHYASCDEIRPDMVDAYAEVLESYSDEQCTVAYDSWVEMGCCAQH